MARPSRTSNELDVVMGLVQAAGEAVIAVYGRDFAVHDKLDGSPITAADEAANVILVEGLRAAFPDDAILSEEAPFEPGRSGRVWMVDPLDGTSDFAGRTGDFSIMVGLCEGKTPVFGLVFAPALGRTWHGVAGEGAYEWIDGSPRALTVRAPAPGDPVRVLVSRKHRPPQIELLLAQIEGAQPVSRGSVGIKCGLLAAGEADLYLHPTLGTSLWDCCAPQAIFEAAGGRFTTAEGPPVPYDPRQPGNPAGILAAHPSLHAQVLTVLAGTTRTPPGD